MKERLLWIVLTGIFTGVASPASATPPCRAEYEPNRIQALPSSDAPDPQDAGETPSAPTIEQVAAQPLPHACDAHGLFVVELSDPPDDVAMYEWAVRDTEGHVVQRGRGPAPHALAFETVDDEQYVGESPPSRDGSEELVQIYRVGQTYQMEVRAIGESGHRSEVTRAEFTFEKTGNGTSYLGLASIVMATLVVAGVGALLVLKAAIGAILAG